MSLSGDIVVWSSISLSIIGLTLFLLRKKKSTSSGINIDKSENLEKKECHFDFYSHELNSLVKKIQSKSSSLKANKLTQMDIGYMFMLEKSESEYLKKIHNMYMDVPEKRRGKKGVKNTPYDLTFSQLTLILQALEEIEKNTKTNAICLKEKAASI